VTRLIAKLEDIRELVDAARSDPEGAFPRLRRLAASEQWQTREVAATALVEIGRRHPAAVVRVARQWAVDPDVNVRRAASEGLRGIVKSDPEAVAPVLDALRAAAEPYVRKSVANVLRNASARQAPFVLAICRRWASSGDARTAWIVKDGLRKLKATHPRDVAVILQMVGP
jgi:3-methyladenine DNA glycosylase AlkC